MPKKFPIPLYNATNDSTSEELFVKRTVYRAYAFYNIDNLKEFKVPAPLKDFWSYEDSLYGRVNHSGAPMLVSSEYLVEIEDGVKVVNFVAAAYRQMRKEFGLALSQGRLPNAPPPLNSFTANGGYNDPRNAYYHALDLLSGQFFKQSLANPALASKITSFEDFLPLYLTNIKAQAKSVPITFSSFVRGPFGSIMHSGLAFEIASYDCGDDLKKINAFITNPCFEFYKQLALKYGFFIDMNVPWRLVADLSSPAMQQFMSLYTGGSVGPIKYFQVYTRAAYLRDIKIFQKSALEVYNAVQWSRPTFKKRYPKKGCSIQVKTIYRYPATSQNMEQFSFLYWLKFYIELKNIEKGNQFTPARLAQFFNNSKNLVKVVDKFHAMGYINNKFDDLRFLNGSLNHALYKKYFRPVNKQNRPFSDFAEYYKNALSYSTYSKY